MIRAPVADASQIADARRRAVEAANALGFDETAVGRVALVATEMGSNLLKHGGGGELLIGGCEDGEDAGLELIALDLGPGIADLSACLQDGYSSAGSAGHGLGAIRRQSQMMQVASWPGRGAVVLARIARTSRPMRSPAPAASWGCICVPKPPEEVCGDACFVIDSPVGRTLLVVDGLGHGPQAAAAAAQAVRVFQRHHAEPVADILERLHAGLRATRGAAVAVARFDMQRARIVYGGIGNISGVVIEDGATRRMVSLAGTAGHVARRVQTFDYPCNDGLVIMFSDGLSASWTLESYPGLTRADPTLIAAVLYRDHSRRRDDVAVLVASGAPA